MPRQAGHVSAAAAIPTREKPRQGDVRWPAQHVAAARERLTLNGYTDDEAGDLLDWLAVVRRVRRLRAFLANVTADDLAVWHATLPSLLGELQAANRPTPFGVALGGVA